MTGAWSFNEKKPKRGLGIRAEEKPLPRTPQRFCKCGEPVVNNKKKYCWECEGKLIRQRKSERRKMIRLDRTQP